MQLSGGWSLLAKSTAKAELHQLLARTRRRQDLAGIKARLQALAKRAQQIATAS
jgi:hypothetical protein